MPDRFNGRNFVIHNPSVTLMRTTPEENRAIGEWIGERINQMEGPVRFLIPEGGVSILDKPGAAVLRSRRRQGAVRRDRGAPCARPARRQVIRVNANINDPAFSDALVNAYRRRCRPDEEIRLVPKFERKELVEKFQQMKRDRVPIVGGGAGTGLSAKCEEAGGIDLIVIYNSGRYRMAGRGSLSGLLAYGNANEIVVEMAREILPVVRNTPVLAGVNGTDPFCLFEPFLRQLKDMGFAGIQNFPDRRPDRRHLPRQSGGDGHVLRAGGGPGPHGPASWTC